MNTERDINGEIIKSLNALQKAGASLKLIAKLGKDQDLADKIANILLEKYTEKFEQGAPPDSDYKNSLVKIFGHGRIVVDYDKPLWKFIEENSYNHVSDDIKLDEAHYPSPAKFTGKKDVDWILLRPCANLNILEWMETILSPGYRFPTLKEYLSFQIKCPKLKQAFFLIGLGCVGTSLRTDNEWADQFLYSPYFSVSLGEKREIRSWPVNEKESKRKKIDGSIYALMLIREKKP